jgi:asparagine synthase (glutamine-hydrolysing)
MGGIIGIVHRDGSPVEPRALASVAARMRHRAVDGDGSWIDGCAGLAKQLFRTSPWDPLVARVETTDRYALVLDGRIANRRELWKTLSRSESSPGTDPELALTGWLAWGERLPERLVGDFALAVWDRAERTLFLARDAMGVKPLFCLEWGQVFAFASEVAAFFGLPGWRGEPDEDGVAEYLSFNPARSPRTLLRGVSRVMPGASARCLPRAFDRLSRPWVLPARISVAASTRRASSAWVPAWRRISRPSRWYFPDAIATSRSTSTR